jgi:hypothetical protein
MMPFYHLEKLYTTFNIVRYTIYIRLYKLEYKIKSHFMRKDN